MAETDSDSNENGAPIWVVVVFLVLGLLSISIEYFDGLGYHIPVPSISDLFFSGEPEEVQLEILQPSVDLDNPIEPITPLKHLE